MGILLIVGRVRKKSLENVYNFLENWSLVRIIGFIYCKCYKLYRFYILFFRAFIFGLHQTAASFCFHSAVDASADAKTATIVNEILEKFGKHLEKLASLSGKEIAQICSKNKKKLHPARKIEIDLLTQIAKIAQS